MYTQSLDAVSASIISNPWIILLIVWSAVWKIIAMWKAAKHEHLTIFILLAILNTAGIFEIIYISYLYFKNKKSKQIPTTPENPIA
jgi:methionyl-tRNA synthetase